MFILTYEFERKSTGLRVEGHCVKYTIKDCIDFLNKRLSEYGGGTYNENVKLYELGPEIALNQEIKEVKTLETLTQYNRT